MSRRNEHTLHLERLYNTDEYKSYLVDKEKITSKYSLGITSACYDNGYKKGISEKDWKLWLKYKKEITDLLFQPNGSYQKFVWKTLSFHEEVMSSRRIKGKSTVTNW